MGCGLFMSLKRAIENTKPVKVEIDVKKAVIFLFSVNLIKAPEMIIRQIHNGRNIIRNILLAKKSINLLAPQSLLM